MGINAFTLKYIYFFLFKNIFYKLNICIPFFEKAILVKHVGDGTQNKCSLISVPKKFYLNKFNEICDELQFTAR